MKPDQSRASHKKSKAVGAKRKSVVLRDADYKNPLLPAERRVQDLLSRMALQEKVAQMVCVWQKKASTLVDDKGNFDHAPWRN
jgi:hypothetical protein